MPQQETPVGPYIPPEGQEETIETEGGGTALIDLSPSSEQIQEWNSGDVIGTGGDGYTQTTDLSNSGLPELLPEETVYKKRIVRVVDGKIVASKIVYIKRYLISASGGFGDGYLILQPNISGNTLTFTPVQLTLLNPQT